MIEEVLKMKEMVLKMVNKGLTSLAKKKLVLTNCVAWCNRGETPEELLK